MRMRTVVLMIMIVLLICGCSLKKADESYPDYFAPIVQELEVSWEEKTPLTNAFVMDKWWDAGALWHGGYEDKSYNVTIDEKRFTFDLKDELTSAEEWYWMEAGVIVDEGEDKTYICLFDFNLMYEGGVQNPQLLLIEFPTHNPEDYKVLPYTVDPYNLFGWDADCYRIGDNIYITSMDGLGAINLNTKQLRYFWDESSQVEEYAQKIYGEEPYHIFFFNATLEQDGVIVYSAEVSEANDFPSIGAIFIAYRDNTPIAYMSVDFTSEKMEDGIEIEMVE